MANRIVLSVVILAVLTGGYLWWNDERSPKQTSSVPTPTDTLTVLPTTDKTPQLGHDTVTYASTGYSPSNLRVKADTTVSFKNTNSKAMWTASDLHPSHRIYADSALSEHCPDNAGMSFDACIGTQPGSSWSFKFTKKGTWNYHNHLMPSHTGTIVVE